MRRRYECEGGGVVKKGNHSIQFFLEWFSFPKEVGAGAWVLQAVVGRKRKAPAITRQGFRERGVFTL